MAGESHKTIFIPNIQGQYKLWKQELAPACNKADAVVQLGNIIGISDLTRDRERNGPNEAVLRYIMLFRATQDNWTQIVGTNEIVAFNDTETWTNARSRQLLRNSWFSEKPTMVVAAVDKNRLITHAGLTYGEWVNIGKPQTAQEAADALNELYQGTLYQGPAYRLGNPPNYAANPIWCDPLMELYPSWVTAPEPPPFGQVHAAGTANSELGRKMISDTTNPMHYLDKVNFRTYGSIVTIGEQPFLSLFLNLPNELVSSIPRPQALYLEKG